MADRQHLDVVVVGGGIAGLVAAVRAAELGLEVAILEKGEAPHYLCNSRISGGVFHVAHHDIRSSGDELLAAINASTYNTADPALAETLASRAAPLLSWLVGHGAKFIMGGARDINVPTAAPPRPLARALDWMTTWQGRGPDQLLRLLSQRLEGFGGKIILGAKADALVMSDRRCVGVEAIVGGERRRFDASAVVLADGGFQANLDLIRETIAPVPEGIKQRNSKTGVGDGLRMAKEIGAALTPLEGFYGHILSRDAMHNDALWPYPLLDDLAIPGTVVDQTGRRIGDEGYGGVYMANVIAGSADPLSAQVICDANIWEAAGRKVHVSSPNPRLEQFGGTMYSAADIPTLAQLAGLPVDALVATVETYNSALRSNSLAMLDPPRTSGRYAPRPIVAPPFRAIPACAGITFTMGGIKINGAAQVVREDGEVIPGLYAAGSTTGGLEGGRHACYVSGLAKAAVFGKHAAEQIAAARNG